MNYNMSLIDLKNICFSYHGGSEGTGEFFLNNIDISINSGEFISILGPNGSGKSTLLKIIAGLLKPSSGKISLRDVEYKSMSKRALARNIAFVPQAALTIFPFSVFEIVMMGRTPYLNLVGYESSKDRQIVNEALELVGISHLSRKGINEVSGGEAQRAFIARAIVQSPEIILLDEPNAHLDIKHQLSIFNLIKKLNSEKKLTVVTVSHDLNLSGFYSDRIIMMKDGSKKIDGSVTEVLTQENIKDVFEVDAKISVNSNLNKVFVTITPTLYKEI